jgi:DNA-binding beta-propeller fold protein YncE
VAFDGTHIWVANSYGPSVSEINAADGSWVRTMYIAPAGSVAPYRLAFDGTHIWATNPELNSVTELNAADGTVIQTPLSSSAYGFNCNMELAYDGTHVWVTNYRGNSVTSIQG